MNNQILINIGNTHIQVADVISGRPRLMVRYDTSAILLSGALPCLENRSDFQAYTLCVVPRLKEALSRRYGEKLHFLTRENFPQLDFSGVDASTIGMDRISNAAFAFSYTKSAVAVFDFGTCINSVVVDERGRFLGGAICPGRMLLRQALAEHTAQLPLLPFRHEKPNAIGTNTRDAIFAGVDGGILGSVRELISQTRSELGKPCPILATGGDADFFLRWLPEILTPAPELMTIKGILYATL